MRLVTLQNLLPSRERNLPPNLIILHATAGSTAKSSIDWLRMQGLSYHYIIARDGRDSAKSEMSEKTDPIVYHCVPNSRHAFHVSSTIASPDREGSFNRNSIGVSLANIQRRINPEPYPKNQVNALIELLNTLKTKVPSLEFLTTHAVIQPWNRSDPLGIDGRSIARQIGLTWWQPTANAVVSATPQRTKISG